MGGFGSGRRGGRPTADSSFHIDLAWMMREGLAREGSYYGGTLDWTCGGEPAGSISYIAAMHKRGRERLELRYSKTRDGEREQKSQTIRLTYTVPNYGGKRWWMECPVSGRRVGKLYLPSGGDIFASRQAWRLGYDCQREAPRDRAFERLFRLQKKLGCEQGWEQPIFRPKGMWQRTWQRHLAEYCRLDRECAVEMMAVMSRLSR